ncbi:MAG: hypothetical protein LBO20_04955, partial [Bifidobacteriaceae bacterium]|nr:hypothetical protein [Bifidobacteriaceae bacterium]
MKPRPEPTSDRRALPDDWPRLPSVNLMPPSVLRARERETARSKGLAALGVAALVIGTGYVGALLLKAAAVGDLRAAQTTEAELKAERRQFAELEQTKARLAAAEAGLTTAMAYEVRWP